MTSVNDFTVKKLVFLWLKTGIKMRMSDDNLFYDLLLNFQTSAADYEIKDCQPVILLWVISV